MTRNRSHKQTRRSVSLSGDLHRALKAHCERAGLSISGFAEMVLRREMGMHERQQHLERSPILMEAYQAAKESSKSPKTTFPDDLPPPPPPKPDPVIPEGYASPFVFRERGEQPEPPPSETTFTKSDGRFEPSSRDVEPLPGPVEVVYAKDWGSLDSEEVAVADAGADSDQDPDVEGAEEAESDYRQIESEEIAQDSEELAVEAASEPVPAPPEIPSNDGELEEEASQEADLGPEDGQLPDEGEQFEREGESSEAVEVVEDDPRPIHAIRMDRPSREFMTKGERERLERARRIAEKEKAEAEKLKAAQPVEEKEEDPPSRLAGNVFSF